MDPGERQYHRQSRLLGEPREASNFLPGTAYVSYTGYRRDDFRPFVYKTTDFGETWTSISANLPEGPVNVIREHQANPELLFVGTEFAVFVSVNGGESWTNEEQYAQSGRLRHEDSPPRQRPDRRHPRPRDLDHRHLPSPAIECQGSGTRRLPL